MVASDAESTLKHGCFRNGKYLLFMVCSASESTMFFMVVSMTESTIPFQGVFYRRFRAVTPALVGDHVRGRGPPLAGMT
jgi:hypothetical protein